HERCVGDRQTGKIADVFAKRQTSVYIQAGLNLVTAELVGDARSAFLKLRPVFRSPPRFQVSVRVELAALIVETVRYLVADHSADSSVIYGVVGRRIKERRLQNARGKIDVVKARVVVRINGRRRHSPTRAVERLCEFVQVLPDLNFHDM